MAYCSYCKVTLTKEEGNCPLCNKKSVFAMSTAIHTPVLYPTIVRNAEVESKKPVELRLKLVNYLCIFFPFLLALTLEIDFIFFSTGGSDFLITTGLVLGLLCIAIPLILCQTPLLSVSFLSQALFLSIIIWKYFSNDLSWVLSTIYNI